MLKCLFCLLDVKGVGLPVLQFDEADVANESYICFRRREIKAIRKTRASQASSSDKLLRLQAELIAAQALVDSVIQRENNKKLAYTEAYNLAEKRLELIELKAMQPSLSVRDDEDLLIDKERPPKRSRTDSSIKYDSILSTRIRHTNSF